MLTRERLKKEQVIKDLTDKLQKVSQQQERDKGECRARWTVVMIACTDADGETRCRLFTNKHCDLGVLGLQHVLNPVVLTICMKCAALIETLSEDRASVMQEKKHLEEELNRLRSTALVSSAFFTPQGPAQEVTEAGAGAGATGPRALSVAGACSSELLTETDRLASVAAIRDDEPVDSAVEASMVTVQ